jgi:hypothetical protein
MHALTREAHVPRDLGHGERTPGGVDCAQHLPAGAREPLAGAEQVAGREQQAVGSEDRADDLGRCVSGWSALGNIVSRLT